MIRWQTDLTRGVLQEGLSRGLALSIALHLLVVSIRYLGFISPDAMPFFDSRRTVLVELQPYAEIVHIETGGGQGGGEGGGLLTAPVLTLAGKLDAVVCLAGDRIGDLLFLWPKTQRHVEAGGS